MFWVRSIVFLPASTDYILINLSGKKAAIQRKRGSKLILGYLNWFERVLLARKKRVLFAVAFNCIKFRSKTPTTTALTSKRCKDVSSHSNCLPFQRKYLDSSEVLFASIPSKQSRPHSIESFACDSMRKHQTNKTSWYIFIDWMLFFDDDKTCELS